MLRESIYRYSHRQQEIERTFYIADLMPISISVDAGIENIFVNDDYFGEHGYRCVVVLMVLRPMVFREPDCPLDVQLS